MQPEAIFAREPDPKKVAEFWSFTREYVGWTSLEPILGQEQASLMEPPWMQLSPDAAEATAMAQQLIADGEAEVITDLGDYPADEDDLPKQGDLAILCDGMGRPVALVSTLTVGLSTVVVEEDVLVGAGSESLLPSETRLVTEKLRCLYPEAPSKK